MGRVVILQTDPPIVDGWYIVTYDNRGYHCWRGAGEYNAPFPTQYAAERAAELDGLNRPYWTREAIGSVLTVSHE